MQRHYNPGHYGDRVIVNRKIALPYDCEMVGRKFEDLPSEVIASKNLRYVWLTERLEFRSFSGAVNYILEDVVANRVVPKIDYEKLPSGCTQVDPDEKKLLDKVIEMYSKLKTVNDVTRSFHFSE